MGRPRCIGLERRWRERRRVREGPREQEDTHYSAICAAEKHKDVRRKACVCVCVCVPVCVCFMHVWVMDLRPIRTWVCYLHE